MKKSSAIIIILLFTIVIMAFTNRNNSGTYIVYKGNKFYYCGTKYRIDTIFSPDGTLQIFNSSIKLYEHFGCTNMK